jgi:hypothetical protein
VVVLFGACALGAGLVDLLEVLNALGVDAWTDERGTRFYLSVNRHYLGNDARAVSLDWYGVVAL